MELSRLTNLCKALGRSDVKEGEEWKTLKYVHTPGQGAPAVDVEILLNRKQITFVNDATKAGFCITEPLYSDVVIPINEDDVDVTTFLDLNHITDLSFLVDDDIVDIYDVVNKLNETSFPIRIGFKTDPTTEFDGENPIFKFKTVKDIKIGYNLSRHLKAGTDYKITFKKETGEIIDKITEPGIYTLTIAGTGKYIGSKTCKIIIDPKL